MVADASVSLQRALQKAGMVLGCVDEDYILSFAHTTEAGAKAQRSDVPASAKAPLRLPTSGAREILDPIAALQDGLPVLFYNVPTTQFEAYNVKVDDHLAFLYVMPNMSGGSGALDPIVMSLQDIPTVYNSEDAIRICHAGGLFSKRLTIKTAVVVQTQKLDRYEDVPPLDKILVFVCAPQLHLKRCIDACIVKSARVDAIAEWNTNTLTGATTNPFYRASRKEMAGVFDDGPQISFSSGHSTLNPRYRLMGIRLQSWDAPLSIRWRECMLDVELRGKNADTHDRKVHIVQTTTSLARADEEIGRFELRHGISLARLDAALFELVVREVIALRTWAEPLATPEGFGAGIHAFLEEPEMATATLVQDDGFHFAVKDVASCQSEASRDGTYVEHAALRAVSIAVGNLLSIEEDFARVARRGVILGVMDRPRCYSLSGQLLPDLSGDILEVGHRRGDEESFGFQDGLEDDVANSNSANASIENDVARLRYPAAVPPPHCDSAEVRIGAEVNVVPMVPSSSANPSRTPRLTEPYAGPNAGQQPSAKRPEVDWLPCSGRSVDTDAMIQSARRSANELAGLAFKSRRLPCVSSRER
mmetsp:Transcript_97094/g.274446  ORF Transcript_97094/g.274446 Transcript_97094/m.274446 type:complete len:590 (+) Transcript_97094:66-1835(+)